MTNIVKIALTGVKRLEFVVDWLNFTSVNRPRASYNGVVMDDNTGNWYPAKAVHGYTQAQENECGARVMWNDKRDDMGIHCMYSGQCLNRYGKRGIFARDIIRHHSLWGDVCKRVDLAIDVLDSPIDIPYLYAQLADNRAKTTCKTYNLITGSTGNTLYVGSRQSDMFLRIYDKGAQKGTDDNWKRVELEVKGSRAISVAREFSIGTDEQMMTLARKLIAGQVMFDDATWREVVGDLALKLGKAKDETPDTVGWLLGQCAPAMAKYINDTGDQNIIEKFMIVVASLTEVN